MLFWSLFLVVGQGVVEEGLVSFLVKGTGYLVGLRNLDRTSLLRSGGRRACMINLLLPYLRMSINLVLKLSILMAGVLIFWQYSVNYYTDRGSHVLCAFINFSNAFDRVNYWQIFNKLLHDNVSFEVVRLLAFWYPHQNVAVLWHITTSDLFVILNGTRQGSALSPYLFTRHIRDILLCIVFSSTATLDTTLVDAWWTFWLMRMT